LSKGGAQGKASTSSSEIPVKRSSPGNGEHFEQRNISRKEEPREWLALRAAKYLSKGGAQGMASASSIEISVKMRGPGKGKHLE
jgi:hypothetical protein